MPLQLDIFLGEDFMKGAAEFSAEKFLELVDDDLKAAGDLNFIMFVPLLKYLDVTK